MEINDIFFSFLLTVFKFIYIPDEERDSYIFFFLGMIFTRTFFLDKYLVVGP